MPSDRDDHAPDSRLTNPRIAERSVDELIGLCRGVLSDGLILEAEAQYLLAWLESNRAAALTWPGNVIYQRVAAMLEDGELDPDEQAELLDLLNETTGKGIPLPEIAASYATALPLCDPPPPITHDGRVFVLTGKFVHGSRTECERIVRALGGQPKSNVTKDLDYLVIGAIGSRDWLHSTHGRKIEAAVELRRSGRPVCIVSEQHWTKFL